MLHYLYTCREAHLKIKVNSGQMHLSCVHDSPMFVNLVHLEAMYIEDIYSFAVNTINIVIECNEDISIFTSAKHE